MDDDVKTDCSDEADAVRVGVLLKNELKKTTSLSSFFVFINLNISAMFLLLWANLNFCRCSRNSSVASGDSCSSDKNDWISLCEFMLITDVCFIQFDANPHPFLKLFSFCCSFSIYLFSSLD